MATTDANVTLVTADVKGYNSTIGCVDIVEFTWLFGYVLYIGFVTLWNIKNYCMSSRSPRNPPRSTYTYNVLIICSIASSQTY